MRTEVKEFIALGPLPSEDADPEQIDALERSLEAISAPVTDTEAEALIEAFGEDNCFGLAWSLVHLIETAPSPFPKEKPMERANKWAKHLYERAPK